MERDKHFVIGVYNDESVLMEAVRKVRDSGVKIHEVYTPYPIHGLDEALGYRRSRLPRVAFTFGLLGTSLALLMQFWMMGVDWPMVIGGKNFTSLPPFIPVTFEMTVLLSALGMVATFFIVADLKPYKKPRIFDIRSTNDKLIMAVDIAANSKGQSEIESVVNSSGAEEVYQKSFGEKNEVVSETPAPVAESHETAGETDTAEESNESVDDKDESNEED